MEVTVASFNLHAGVDGWGRPFDWADACKRMDADILVLQENWSSDVAPHSLAQQFANEMGYTAFEQTMATGRRARPDPQADERWMHSWSLRGPGMALTLDSKRAISKRALASRGYLQGERGALSLAVLCRLPVDDHRVVTFPDLPRDTLHRYALVIRSGPLSVVGTHMSHLTHGSFRHFGLLARELDTEARAREGFGRPTVLLGDLNTWGPPLRFLLPHCKRAVRGPSWPAWRPHSQLDHILLQGPITARAAAVLPDAGSDHCPVRASLTYSASS